jgi:hypothetical protein
MRQNQPKWRWENLNAQVIMERSKIFASKCWIQLSKQMTHSWGSWTDNDEVINIYEDIHGHLRRLVDEQWNAYFAGSELQCTELWIECRVSNTWHLFQAIHGFLKFAHMMRMIGSDEARRLWNINSFLKIPIQECILDICLPNTPTFGYGNGEDETNNGGLNNWAKRLSIIKTITLAKAFGDQSGFVAFTCAICMMFHLKNPLAINQTLARTC